MTVCASPAAAVVPQVIALSDLIVEVWGLPQSRMFAQGSYRASQGAGGRGGSKRGGAAGGRHGDGSGHPDSGTSGSAEGTGGHGELPSNSIFLGAVTVSCCVSGGGQLLVYGR
jgi:hypothetical protein